MANALYGLGKQKLLTGAINLSSDTIKAALVSTAYTVNLTTDEWYSTISSAVLGTPATLSTKTVALGVFDADDVTYTAVSSGSTVRAVVIYRDSGLASSSALLAYIDTISGFPLATNGGNIQVQWDNGSFKIFSL